MKTKIYILILLLLGIMGFMNAQTQTPGQLSTKALCPVQGFAFATSLPQAP